MKFKTYLETIVGVEIYPIFSLILFVLFFAIVALWILRMDRQEIDQFKNLPLD